MAARGRGLFSLYIYKENFKNLLVRNHWTDFYIILQKCSFSDPLPRLFKPFGFVKKHGRQGAGLIFPIYLYRKLKKSSCHKPLDQLLYNFAEIFLWWFCTKIVQAIWICQKHGRQGVGLIFPIYLYRKLEKSSCQKPLDQFHYKFGKNVSMVTLYQDCSSNRDSSKNMATRGRGLFSLYIYIKNFKNLLLRNRWTEFNVTWLECCFCDPLPRLFKLPWYVNKHGPQGAGLISHIYLYRKL